MNSRARILEIAEECVRTGQLERAIAEYSHLLDGGANDTSISLIIGDLQLKLGRRDEALKTFVTNMVVLDKRGAFAQALAVAKKVHKLDPSNGEIRERMGDLYSRMGFDTEARSEYAEAARRFQEQRDVHGRIAVYEKLVALDRTDLESRAILARLLAGERLPERAAAEWNAIADVRTARGDDAAAERALREALALDSADVRTVSSLVRLLRRTGRRDQAIRILAAALDVSARLELLLLLGEVRAEAGDSAGARECYARVISQDPENAAARGQLGRLEIQAGQPDRAFALLEPLISQAIRRGRHDRAVGWLGLILISGGLHVLSLEKLASIFRLEGKTSELELVDRLLLREYRRRGLDADRRRILEELVALAPRDRELAEETAALDAAAPAPPAGEPGPAEPSAEAGGETGPETITTILTQVDHLLEQGLFHNARRFLENLQMTAPGDPRIESRLELLREREKSAEPVDISGVLRRILSLESETAGGAVEEPLEPPPPSPPPAFPAEEPPVRVHKTVSLEDIFGSSDLTVPAPRDAEAPVSGYPDLTDTIREEREALEQSFYGQLKAREARGERGLADIVTDFRRRIEQRVARDSRDVRYNLGLAFMEQGLLAEAVEEFRIAMKDEAQALDCMSLISQCYRKMGDFDEALVWADRALRAAPAGSGGRLALTYDLAQIREDMNETAAALALYREVEASVPRYRDTALRIKTLGKLSG